jgi:hypothetical protein
MLTMSTTDATPMMIPSMVRTVRDLLTRIARNAEERVSERSKGRGKGGKGGEEGEESEEGNKRFSSGTFNFQLSTINFQFAIRSVVPRWDVEMQRDEREKYRRRGP